jgi:heptosyltransferase-2
MNSPDGDSQVVPGFKLNCRNYRGDRPCAAGLQGVCPQDCDQFSAMGHRVLVIKLGALGDVIRTAALLPGLKEAWPQSHITWVTRPSGVRMLANHPLIDRLLVFDSETLGHLKYESFDLCLSLDKEAAPAALAMQINARDRRGIGLSRYGTAYPLNSECTYYFRLGLDDRLKFAQNQKSYQQLIYEALGLEYRGQRQRLYPDAAHRVWARQCWQDLGVQPDESVVGLNTGAGRVFANKNWPDEKYVALARRLMKAHGWRVAVLGGPDERERNRAISDACPGVLKAGCDHGELQFAALVRHCNVLVTGDTMALHVAVAQDVPVVGLFGPTCAQEIDLYGRGEKIETTLACAPCYRRHCDQAPHCMDNISVERVLTAVQHCMGVRTRTGARTRALVEVAE